MINGNVEFTPANGVTSGSGTPSDPYIIEGWEIDGSANSGIEVYNTDAHFVIRDLYLHSALIDGIFLYSVQNARVENATMPLNDIGVYIQVSSNVTVASSNISFSTLDAIEVDASSNVTVEGNEMWINGDWGVFAYGSVDLVIRNNTISSNGWAGIELSLGSDRVLVQGNRVANNNIAGLILDQASNVTIIDNTFPDNDFNVDLTNSNDVLIRNNTIATSTSDGLTITGGTRLTVEENNITGNGGGALAVGVTGLLVRHNAFNGNSPQAADNAATNAWDDGYPSGGNYWSDYAGMDNCSGPNQDVCPIPDGIGDTPYVIDADSQDRYPLMQPYTSGRAGYTVTIIPPLPGDAYAVPFGINETGAVVGWSTTGGFERPFLYTDAGGTVPLPFAPNTTRGSASDISDTGIVVGALYGPNQTHAMRWPPGGPPQDLGTMGGPTSTAAGVNATGAVAGNSDYGGPLPKAFLYTDAAGFIDIAPLASGMAFGANDAGVVAGTAGARGIRWVEGVLEDLGGVGAYDASRGRGINQVGQVAGCVYNLAAERAARFTDGVGWEVLGGAGDSNCGYRLNAYGDVVGIGLPTGVGIVRAFLYTDAGGMQDLERMTDRAPLLRLLAAYDINDRGQIVGFGWDNAISQYVGFRLEPTVPQPPNHSPTVTVIAPNGAEFWGSGSTRPVEWRMTDLEDGVLSVTADLSVDGGLTFPYPMFAGPIGQGKKTHPWTLPMLATTTARIRICVSDSEGLSACDTSDTDFTINSSAVVILVDTNPTGFQVRVDGVNHTAPYQLGCAPATTHSVEAPASRPINASSRYGFANWSDGGALAHDIVCDANRTITANYSMEFQLVLDTSPTGLPLTFDSVSFTAPLVVWCVEGTSHTVAVVSPAPGPGPDQRYVFQYWLEDGSTLIGRSIACTGAARYTAVYITEYRLILDTSPPGLTVVLDGVNLMAPATIWCRDLSVYAIGAPSPQFLGGDRYEFSSWSDGGAQFHSVACTAPATITAFFLGPFLTAPSVTVTSPNFGEDWTGGSAHQVTWTTSDPDDATLTVYVNLSVDGGATFPVPLYSGTLPVGPNSYDWTLPLVNTTSARISVCVLDSRGTSACDTSDGVFVIDSTPPAVASVVPGDGATDVPLAQPLEITFSEPMDAASIPPSAILLAPAVTGLVPSWSPDRRILTVSHEPFAPCTTYQATVEAGVQDASDPGNAAPAAYAWSFATVCPPSGQIIAPLGGERWTGGSTHPVRFRAADDVDTQVQVWLNATLDGVPTTVFSGLVPIGESEIPWTVPATTAAVTLHLAVADRSGLTATASSGAFTIDGAPPALISTSPAGGTVDASVGVALILAFSEPMDPAATQAAVSMVPSGPTMAFSWDTANTTLTIRFAAPLAPGTDYVVTVGCGARDDSDPGNPLGGCPGAGVRFDFQTKAAVPPPVARAVAGAQARVGVPVTLDGRGSTGDIVSWSWTIADAAGAPLATLDGPLVAHTFAAGGRYTVTLRVVDSVGQSDEYTFDVVVEDAGNAWVPTVVLLAAALAALGFAASEPGRVALVTATAARLYARKPKNEKDSEIRGAVLYYVRVHPGDCYMDIKRNLQLNDGVVTYHLARLEKDALIKSVIRGARKRYYPAEVRVPLEDGGELHEIQQRMLHFVAKEPGMPVALLAEQLGVSYQLTLYHLRKLAGADRVGLERRGLRLRAFPESREH